MGSLNTVTLCGNVGNDPELRSTSGGGRVANLSLATSQKWNAANGSKQEETQWHKLICWNGKSRKLADLCEAYVKKGDSLLVTGQIKYRAWTDKDGTKHYATEIHVNDVVLLGRVAKQGAAGATAAVGAATDVDDVGGECDDDLPF